MLTALKWFIFSQGCETLHDADTYVISMYLTELRKVFVCIKYAHM